MLRLVDADSDGVDAGEVEASPEPHSLKIDDRGRIVSPDAVRQSGHCDGQQTGWAPSPSATVPPNFIMTAIKIIINLYYLYFYRT